MAFYFMSEERFIITSGNFSSKNQIMSNEFNELKKKKMQTICITKGHIDYKTVQKWPDILHDSLFPFKMLFAWILHNDHLCFGLDFKITGQ